MATIVITERPEREADIAAVRNNLLYAVKERRYRREFNLFSDTSRVGENEILLATGLPQIGDPHPYDAYATCIKVGAKSSGASRKYWRAVCEYDSSWLINSITDNPLNQLPEIIWSGGSYDRALYRDAFGVPIKTSAKQPFDPPLTVDDNRSFLRVKRNEATFNEAYARLWRKRLNKTTFAGAPALQARLNTLEAARQVSNGILFYQVSYEIEFRDYPDTFIQEVQDKDFRNGDGILFTDPRTAQPLQNATFLNGIGRNIIEAKTRLLAAMTNVATTLTIAVADRINFPPPKKPPNADGIVIGPDYEFEIKIDNEIMRVTAESGISPITWTVIRGYAGTTAAAHAVGALITLEPYHLRFIPHGYAEFADLGLPTL